MSETREPEEDGPPKKLARADDLLGRKDSRFRKELAKTWDQVKKAFEDQAERSDELMDYWNAYECKLDENQIYQGDACVFVPLIHDAVIARKTRFANQLCPSGAQWVEAFSVDGSRPRDTEALIQQYFQDAQFKTSVVEPLCVMGDIEGQYNLYVDWASIEREIVSRETRNTTAMLPGEEIEVPGEEIDDIVSETVGFARPYFEILHDSDVVVHPASADTIEEALAAGGFVAIARRWSKAKVEALISAGQIREDQGDELIHMMDAQATSLEPSGSLPYDVEKQLIELVGIRKKGSEVTVWEVWKLEPLNDRGQWSEKGHKRICRLFLGPAKMVLGGKRNPYWNDRLPLFSRPVEKVAGVFKGVPPVKCVMSLQYEANDAANEGADVAHRTAMPIVKRDPAAGNKPLLLNVGALWDVPPKSVEFAAFPDLTPRAIARIQYCTQQVFQSLGVNPSMLPQQTRTTKPNQALIAQEQQVDLLTTAAMVTVQEEGIYTPVVGFVVDLDYQFRENDLLVRTHGAMGARATIEPIPPLKTREYYRFKWWGADQARFNAMQYQQMIAWMNVVSQPNVAEQLARDGYVVDLVPIIEASALAIMGPRYGDKVIRNERQNLSLPPELENQLLAEGADVPISIFDQGPQHIQAHMRGKMMFGDPFNKFHAHIQAHLIAEAAKQKAQMMQAAAQAIQGQQHGSNGGGRPGPRAGAQPAGPRRGAQQPPGMLRPEQMSQGGGIMMPRRF